MKKRFLVLFCFISMFAFSQEYHFDCLLKYDSVSERYGEITTFRMASFSDASIFMEIGQNMISKEFYAILIDSDKKNAHRFKVDDPSSNHIIFEYVNSWTFKDIKHYKYDSLDVKRLDGLKFSVKTVGEKKTKKKELELHIELMPFEKDLMKIDYEPLTYAEENKMISLIKSKLSSEEKTKNYMIKNFSSNSNSGGIAIKRKLKEVKKVNVQIKVDNKKIIN